MDDAGADAIEKGDVLGRQGPRLMKSERAGSMGAVASELHERARKGLIIKS